MGSVPRQRQRFEDMLGAFMDDCVQSQWKEASRRAAGEDLERGVDVATVRIEHNRMAAEPKLDEWTADQWARERQS
eukprot:6927834-Pyramimonas_sp.AAC.1